MGLKKGMENTDTDGGKKKRRQYEAMCKFQDGCWSNHTCCKCSGTMKMTSFTEATFVMV